MKKWPQASNNPIQSVMTTKHLYFVCLHRELPRMTSLEEITKYSMQVSNNITLQHSMSFLCAITFHWI